MNYLLVIVNSKNQLFSHKKKNSPQMYNQMKELCTKYEAMFKGTFKVKRIIITNKGFKFI